MPDPLTACLHALSFTFLHISTLTIKVNSQMTGTLTSIDWIDNLEAHAKKKKIKKLRKQEACFTDVLRTKLFSNLSQLY